MCRFLVYKGRNQILLSNLILDPAHSILTQSYDSRLRLDTRRPHNGDGFGVGYYTDPKLGPEPCIFTSTIPAWNCLNLERLASKTTSNLIFAHVRATTEGNLSDQNCHPFRCNALMWMHNGGIGGWNYIKRELAMQVNERWFMHVNGSTDSEWTFALFLHCLEELGVDPMADPGPNGFGHAKLRQALRKTIEIINEHTSKLKARHPKIETISLLNFAVTDGHSVVCSRYVNSLTDEAASLFFSSGTSWMAPTRDCDKGEYRMERRDKGSDIVLVASEPLTFERDNWVTVPTNSTLTIYKQTVMIHPIEDEFYVADPSYQRSSKLAREKGQLSDKSRLAVPSIKDVSPPALDGENTQDLIDSVSIRLGALDVATPS